MTPKASNEYLLSLQMVVLREKGHMFAESCFMGTPHSCTVLDPSDAIMSHDHLGKHPNSNDLVCLDKGEK